MLAKARELNYKPNRVAQSLALQNNYNIYVIIPYYPTSFYSQVRAGVNAAQKELEHFGLSVSILPTEEAETYREKELLEQALAENVDGVAILPINTRQMKEPINRVVDSDIPVLTFVSDLEDSERFCFIGLNNFRGGRLAGELMGKFLNGSGKVAVITNYTFNSCNNKRLQGFCEMISDQFPGIDIVSVLENYDQEKRAYRLTRKLVNEHKDLKGIFVTNVCSPGTARALIDTGYEKKIRLIGFDITEEITKMMKKGIIYATICQEPFRQGYQAVKYLYNYIDQEKKPPKEKVLTLPKVLFAETLIKEEEMCNSYVG